MCRVIPLPARLRAVFTKWDALGRPPQPPIRWSRDPWYASFPDHQAFLAALPNPIDRRAVAALAADAHGSPDAAARAFVAAMVWGYGRVGYGAFRTARVLTENDAPAHTLTELAERTRTDGGLVAFEWLAGHRLSGLGVAFATKYLCFCSMGTSSTPALILDRLVQRWLTTHAGWKPSLNWSVADYGCFVRNIEAWAKELGLDPFTVEYLLFWDEVVAKPSNQWAVNAAPRADEGPESIAEPSPKEDDENEALLAAIERLASTFAETTEGWRDEDVQDFDFGLRQLRRIVLAQRRRRS